jgi:hypothetical protein
MLSLPQSGQQTGSNTMVLSHSMIVSSIPAKFSIDGNTSRTLPSIVGYTEIVDVKFAFQRGLAMFNSLATGRMTGQIPGLGQADVINLPWNPAIFRL